MADVSRPLYKGLWPLQPQDQELWVLGRGFSTPATGKQQQRVPRDHGSARRVEWWEVCTRLLSDFIRTMWGIGSRS
jgi:hypothetical protein